MRHVIWPVLCLTSTSLLLAQPAAPFGLQLGKVPEILYAQLPQLPKNQGVLVEGVEGQSPAWRGGLRRFDVIVALNNAPIQDPQSFEEKLRSAKPGQKNELAILRGGREMVLAFDAGRKENAREDDYLFPKSAIKLGGPPAVTIQMQNLDNGNLSLVLTFYGKGGKMERLSYQGQLSAIEQQIRNDSREKRLPERVQDLVDIAVQRVRTLNQNQR